MTGKVKGMLMDMAADSVNIVCDIYESDMTAHERFEAYNQAGIFSDVISQLIDFDEARAYSYWIYKETK